jgi:hypothetical protein
LNEFLDWARKNARPLAAGAAGLLALSILIGFLIGHAQRSEYGSALPPGATRTDRKMSDLKQGSRERGGENAVTPQKGVMDGAVNPRMLPPPIVPGFDEGIPSFSFILDRADAVLKDMEPVPLKISELLENRAADVRPDVKPFVFNNEEFDVLVETNELAEP